MTVNDNRYVLVFPALILLVFNSIMPLLVVLNYSFTTPFGPQQVFEGLNNFTRLLHDPAWWSALGRNALFTLLALVIQIPLGLGLALVVRGRGKLISLTSTVIILPSLIPFVSIGLLWRLMTLTGGPVPQLLNAIGINYELMSPGGAFWTLVIMDSWHWTSLVFLLISASLITIPDSYYIAARIDGSTRWQTFRYITLPGIRYSLVLVMVLRLIDTLRIYDENFILTGGGPGRSSELVSLFIVKKALREWAGGFSAAAAVVYLVIDVLLVFLLIMIMTRGKGMLERS